jgi:hypothetical protein
VVRHNGMQDTDHGDGAHQQKFRHVVHLSALPLGVDGRYRRKRAQTSLRDTW